MEILVQTSEKATSAESLPTDLGFGQVFADEMFTMTYLEGEGWQNAAIVPYGPLHLDPSAMVFHYAEADTVDQSQQRLGFVPPNVDWMPVRRRAGARELGASTRLR